MRTPKKFFFDRIVTHNIVNKSIYGKQTDYIHFPPKKNEL